MPGWRRDSITGRDAGTASLRAFLFQRGWCSAFYLCYILFINSNSNRHVLLTFIETKLARLLIVVKSISASTTRQRRPGLIVVIAHWTTVSLSTASRLSRRLCLLYCPGVVLESRHVLDKAPHTASQRLCGWLTATARLCLWLHTGWTTTLVPVTNAWQPHHRLHLTLFSNGNTKR